MCLAKAVYQPSTADFPDIADVVAVAVDGPDLVIETLFGETFQRPSSRITRIDARSNTIFLAREDSL
ncbi:MAG: CooT family nickel-binding protein [Telmatospirillum sp.]|nr:CooT family nickel-binding protein [Telmatospirillum sp.]